jgi:dienelactone hydrolase
VKLAAAIVLASSVAAAQDANPRYEILRRLRGLESTWLRSAPETRAKAAPVIEAAREAWAEGQEPGCAKLLDRATGILRGGSGANDEDALSVTLSRRLCDANEPVWLVVDRYYGQRHAWVDLGIWGRFEGVPATQVSADLLETEGGTDTRVRAKVETAGMLGDRWLLLQFSRGGHPCHAPDPCLSIVERRDERLSALSKAIEALPASAPRLERETAKRLHSLLMSLAAGSNEAHEYLGAGLLAEAEEVVAAAKEGERWYGPARAGVFLLALPVEGSSVRTHVLVPAALTKEKPAPLLIALHGRVFDGDTWFDGYGDGQAVKLARERGWMLVAPDCDGNEDAARLEGIVKALADAYPVDTTRVMLLGHSRGGGSALKAAREAPTRFRAVAAIGAVLPAGDAKTLAKVPLHLAAGDEDFARKDVEAFHAALLEAGSTSATLKVHPHAEHWLAVTAALPDVFAWLDAQAK